MNKDIPCYVISDLLPLYQEDLLSEQTKKEVDDHLNECLDCRKKMDAVKMQIVTHATNIEPKIDPLKKVRFYQKALTVLGAVITFILGACFPIAVLGFTVLERGEIASFQIQRIKGLWYVFALRCCIAGILVCAVYFLLILLIRKMISKHAA